MQMVKNMFLNIGRFMLYAGAAMLVAGCSHKHISDLRRAGIDVTTASKKLSVSAHPGERLQMQYLGCGGLLIRQSGQAIMIDPFFSNPLFLKIGRSMLLGGKIRSNAKALAFGKKRILDSLGISAQQLQREVSSIFVAHGHYDHLMDVPWIQRNWFEGQPHVYANTSSVNTCGNVIARDKLHDVEPIMAVRDQTGTSIDLSASNGTTMRIYPIMAAHNPHADHIKLFSGSVMQPVAGFTKPSDKTSVNDWLEGHTLSFLIDLERNDTIVFRMFVQSSSCQFPDGLPPASLLAKKKVDVAALGVASFQFSENTYPCSYLEAMKPAHVVFIHWEDFFTKYQRAPRSVMKTDVVKFFNHLLPSCPVPYTLPAPGVVMEISY